MGLEVLFPKLFEWLTKRCWYVNYLNEGPRNVDMKIIQMMDQEMWLSKLF